MATTIKIFRPTGNVYFIAFGMTVIFPPLSYAVVHEFWPEWALVAMFAILVVWVGISLAAWAAYRTSILVVDREQGVIQQRGPGSFDIPFSSVNSVRIVNLDSGDDVPPYASVIISTDDKEFKLNYLFFGSGLQTDCIRQTLKEIFTGRVNEG